MNKSSQGMLVFLAANASYSHTSLAGGYLGSVAMAAGWNWRTVETIEGPEPSALIPDLLAMRPDILAATFYLFNRNRLLSIIRRFKALCPACVVIGGGPEFDGDNRDFLHAEPAVDLVVRGEGELVLSEWLASFKQRERWPGISGVCMLDRRGRYHDGGWSRAANDLDELPSPYTALPDISRKPFLQLETTRGCTNRCTFCRSGGRDALRLFSPARVRTQLRELRSAGVPEVRILDRTFNEPPRRARDLLRMLIEEFDDLRFHLEIDPGRLTDAFVKVLAAAPAGQLHIEAGIQTLHPGAWRRMKRGTTPRRALAGLGVLTAMPNLVVHADLIAGLPGADLESLRADIAAMMEAGPAELQLEILKILPGTVLRATAADAGLVYAPDPPYEVLRSAEMSAEDLNTCAAWSRAIDWFYNQAALRASTRSAAQRLPAFWERAIEVVRQHGAGISGTPGLRNRFLWLAELVRADPDLLEGLRLEWMRRGLGERAGFVEPRPWRGPVPGEAQLVGGAAPPGRSEPRRVRLKLWEQDHVFEYHVLDNGQRLTVVYRLPLREATGSKP